MRHQAIMLLILLIVQPAQAGPLVFSSGEPQVTLLELYTSQGCSSCPPAERWLNAYVQADDLWQRIVPVALHVDYWDYLGWQDPYASAANSQRQRAYAQAGQARTVYTPGVFANGQEWRGWSWRKQPPASGKRPGNLEVRVQDDELLAQFAVTDKPLLLNVAVLGFGIDTEVLRGENRDRTLRQEFVSLARVSEPSANGHWRLRLPEYQRQGVARFGLAVWVTAPDQTVPLQATGGWLQ